MHGSLMCIYIYIYIQICPPTQLVRADRSLKSHRYMFEQSCLMLALTVPLRPLCAYTCANMHILHTQMYTGWGGWCVYISKSNQFEVGLSNSLARRRLCGSSNRSTMIVRKRKVSGCTITQSKAIKGCNGAQSPWSWKPNGDALRKQLS